jgi:sec-independent protein translocase protein TatA
MIGATEILIIGGVVFVLFGATAIPKFAKSLGKAKREFQKGVGDDSEENSNDAKEAIEEKK